MKTRAWRGGERGREKEVRWEEEEEEEGGREKGR